VLGVIGFPRSLYDDHRTSDTVRHPSYKTFLASLETR
jgi:hypothetical protein